jgi:hypothetical protein
LVFVGVDCENRKRMPQADPAAITAPVGPRAARSRAGASVAWTLWGLSAAATTGGVVLWAASGFATPPVRFSRGPATIVADLVVVLAFASVGLLLTVKRPNSPIGWIFQGVGLTTAWIVFTTGYVTLATWGAPGLPAVDVVAWVTSSVALAVLAVLTIPVMLLFPDGRLVSPGWGRVCILAGVGATLLAVGFAFAPGALVWFPGVYNPCAWTPGHGAWPSSCP